MIVDILLFIGISTMAYFIYQVKNEVKTIKQKKCGCKDKEHKKDPYKDWRDPASGLLKSRKNTMI